MLAPDDPGFLRISRRALLSQVGRGIGAAALALLLDDRGPAQGLSMSGPVTEPGGAPRLPARAKRVIWLFQSGAPSQYELFDEKPEVRRRHGEVLPSSFFKGQRLTGMTSGQGEFRIVQPAWEFRSRGQSGMRLSELLPEIGRHADRICLIRSLYTEAINHDPAITFFTSGFQQAGRPSAGAWVHYGLGSVNQDLPGFVVMVSKGSAKRDQQALYGRLWGAGFLPAEHQGTQLMSGRDPVLFLQDAAGVSREQRRRLLDLARAENESRLSEEGDPAIAARIAQAELAFRMQTSVPELIDLAGEPKAVLDAYGPEVHRPGSFARNCLLARRLAERDVRFVQLFHRGWDQHGQMKRDLPLQCRDVDRPIAALLDDLASRGLLDETLVVFAGEFGRTVYQQGGPEPGGDYGRDHHPRAFSVFLAGGGVRGGTVHGESDDLGFDVVRDPVHVHDLNATVLHLLGLDHEKLTYRFQGRDYRLTDVAGRVVTGIIG